MVKRNELGEVTNKGRGGEVMGEKAASMNQEVSGSGVVLRRVNRGTTHKARLVTTCRNFGAIAGVWRGNMGYIRWGKRWSVMYGVQRRRVDAFVYEENTNSYRVDR